MTSKEILELVKREGDSREFEIDGLKCLIKRPTSLKTLCGYVYLTKDFPEYGKGYDEIGVHCHGGLTYSAKCGKYWVIGFDCGHYGDIIPSTLELKDLIGIKMSFFDNGETYKDMEFVEAEIINLVNQLDRTNFDLRRKREKKIKDLCGG